MKRLPRLGIRGVLTLATFALAGSQACLFFETRTPDEGGGEESFWQPPTSPSIIVTNLEVAFENEIFNDYRRALTSDFAFDPDDADSFQIEIERPGERVFTNWTRDVEVQVAEGIVASAESVSVNFEIGTEEILGDDRLLKKKYILSVIAGTGTSTFQGEAWFYTRQVAAGEWFIYRWVDIRTPSDPPSTSWGLLKGRSRLPGS